MVDVCTQTMWYEESSEDEDEDEEVAFTALSYDEYIDVECDILEFIDMYVDHNILEMSKSNFHATLVDEVTAVFAEAEETEAWITVLAETYFDMAAVPPRRSHSTTPVPTVVLHKQKLKQKLVALQAAPQPAQRTPAWYAFRHNVITASNLGKIFASEAQRNSLIYEKCKPSIASNSTSWVNTESAMHWGQKYEPVAVMLYERKYNTRVGEFGCIQHPTCPCIAASPDGINVDEASPRYGRMLEIKNIVNREIDGVPSDLYWIQMQIQMETCDLETCDFLETRFREYSDAEAFWQDDEEDRGIMLLFTQRVEQQGHIHYEYMPLDIPLNRDAVQRWISDKELKFRDTWILYSTHYWYLDEMSCVLVERNREWFSAARPLIISTWHTIEQERISGYEHRAPKRRATSTLVVKRMDYDFCID